MEQAFRIRDLRRHTYTWRGRVYNLCWIIAGLFRTRVDKSAGGVDNTKQHIGYRISAFLKQASNRPVPKKTSMTLARQTCIDKRGHILIFDPKFHNDLTARVT